MQKTQDNYNRYTNRNSGEGSKNLMEVCLLFDLSILLGLVSSDSSLVTIVLMVLPLIAPVVVVVFLVSQSRTKSSAVEINSYVTELEILKNEDVSLGIEETKENHLTPKKQKTSYANASKGIETVKDVMGAFAEGGTKNG